MRRNQQRSLAASIGSSLLAIKLPKVLKLIGFLAMVGLVLAAASPNITSLAQEKQPETSVPEMPAEDDLAATSEVLKIEESEEPKNVFKRIDKAFEVVVEKMGLVLFYKLWPTEEEFVQVEDFEYYYREQGTQSDFSLLNDESQTKRKVEITRLEILGKLQLSKSKTALRKGKLGNRLVEYVVVVKNNKKYVRRGDLFLLETPMRSLLDESDSLTEEQIEQYFRQGKLGKSKSGDHIQTQETGAPIVVLWLACGAVFFTIYMKGYNIWGFRHAIEVVRGKYDNPDEPGEVTHFQALASALSATVGLGNIAGVTIAMTTGGPGAFFWMLACGVFGMTSKFVECTLGQKYRQVKPDGTVLGGPMQYLHAGLKELGLGPLGWVLSIVFAVMCILASFGGGNMFQGNQSGQLMLSFLQAEDSRELGEINSQIKTAAKAGNDDQVVSLQQQKDELKKRMEAFGDTFKPAFGLVLAALVGVVIIGGIKRIGAAASKVVPTMCLIYIAACMWIILVHIAEIPAMIGLIFSEAFSPKAFGGGMLGVLVVGVQRAAFSNEAGVGSAAIAHSAAKTDEPVREGSVALLGPFIDTVVVCSMTALVILVTGAWKNAEWIVEQGLKGTPLTSKAFEQEISWFPVVLTIAVMLFAYSSIISWSYYGERCWERLFGARSTIVYRILYVVAAFVGVIVNLGAVLDFSDMMILSMAFPNILGLILLSPKVRRDLMDYWRRYKAGEFETNS